VVAGLRRLAADSVTGTGTGTDTDTDTDTGTVTDKGESAYNKQPLTQKHACVFLQRQNPVQGPGVGTFSNQVRTLTLPSPHWPVSRSLTATRRSSQWPQYRRLQLGPVGGAGGAQVGRRCVVGAEGKHDRRATVHDRGVERNRIWQ